MRHHPTAEIAIETVMEYVEDHDDIGLLRFAQFRWDATEAYESGFPEAAAGKGWLALRPCRLQAASKRVSYL